MDDEPARELPADHGSAATAMSWTGVPKGLVHHRFTRERLRPDCGAVRFGPLEVRANRRTAAAPTSSALLSHPPWRKADAAARHHATVAALVSEPWPY